MEIRIENLTKEIENRTIFSDINITSNTPEIIGIVGRNGVGKTTLFKTIVGLYQATDGEVYVDGELISDSDYTNKNIIYVPDKFDYFNNFTLGKVVKIYKDIYDDFDVEKFYSTKDDIGLLCKKDTRLSSLSKGELTILSVLLAKATNCPILLIDEPFDGVDVINIKKLNKLLLDEDKTIFISSHRLVELQMICNRIFFIEGEEGIIEVSNDESNNFYKVQVVFSEDIPKQFNEYSDAHIIEKIGRVANVVFNCKKEDIIKFLEGITDIVQYDFLNITLEDIFIYKDKEGLHD